MIKKIYYLLFLIMLLTNIPCKTAKFDVYNKTDKPIKVIAIYQDNIINNGLSKKQRTIKTIKSGKHQTFDSKNLPVYSIMWSNETKEDDVIRSEKYFLEVKTDNDNDDNSTKKLLKNKTKKKSKYHNTLVINNNGKYQYTFEGVYQKDTIEGVKLITPIKKKKK